MEACLPFFSKGAVVMIRTQRPQDIERIMEIWLQGNLSAHSQIERDYWENNLPFVKEAISKAQVYVYEEQGAILGFIGLEGDDIAGLFVEQPFRSKGIGAKLLSYVKETHNALTLSVYCQNQRAVAFYLRQGFSIQSQRSEQSTGESEYEMKWQKKEN